MARLQETRTTTPIAVEVGTFLAREDTWEDALRTETLSEARIKYWDTIRREADLRFGMKIDWARREREEELTGLKRRVFKGETLGDPDQDICFACLERLDEEVVAATRRLRENIIEPALAEGENPLVLMISVRDGEIVSYEAAELTEPGLVLQPNKFEIKEEEEASSFKLALTVGPGYVRGWQLTTTGREIIDYHSGDYQFYFLTEVVEICRGLSLHEAMEKEGEVIIWLVGQGEIRDFIRQHQEEALMVLKTLAALIENTDKHLLTAKERITGLKDASRALDSLYKFFEGQDWYPQEKLEAERAGQNLRKEKLKLWRKSADAWLAMRITEMVGAFFGEEGEVVWVEDGPETLLRFLGIAESNLEAIKALSLDASGEVD